MSAADREDAPPKAKVKDPGGKARATSGGRPGAKGAAPSKEARQAAAREASRSRSRARDQDDAAEAARTADKASDESATTEDAADEVVAAPPPAVAPDVPENKWILLLSRNSWVVVPLLLPVAIVVGLVQGAQAVLLLLIGAALVGVISLFWGSLRTLFGETPLSGADAYAIAAPRAEEEQKQAVLRALKDLEFERSVGKISDEDYGVLVAKYRAEAKRLLRSIEEEARPRRERVEWLVQERLLAAGLAPTTDTFAYRSGPAEIAAQAKADADDKKGKKKSKMKGADKPVVPPSREVEIEPEASPEAEKPSVEVTLKSHPPATKTKESPAYVPPTKTCAECGVKNDPDANFCKKCGSKSFEKASTNEKASAKVDVEAAAEQASSGEAESGGEAEKEAEAEAEADAAEGEEEARS